MDIESNALIDKLFDLSIVLIDCAVDCIELLQFDYLVFILCLLVGADEGIPLVDSLRILVIFISKRFLVSYYLPAKLFV
jgi:hypothetical protein